MKHKIIGFLKKDYPDIDFEIFYPPEGFGDYSTNVAFLLAKRKEEDPQKIAEEVVEKLGREFNEFERIEIARQGFINFYLSPDFLKNELEKILEKNSINRKLREDSVAIKNFLEDILRNYKFIHSRYKRKESKLRKKLIEKRVDEWINSFNEWNKLRVKSQRLNYIY